MGFELKAAVFKQFVAPSYLSDLPSHREAQIQVEKFERMVEKFSKKYPIEVVKSLPKKKLRKLRGHDKHLINAQGKIVDRVCMKMIEECVNALFATVNREQKITKVRITKARKKEIAQQYIERLNATVHKAVQRSLNEAWTAAAASLTGVKIE